MPSEAENNQAVVTDHETRLTKVESLIETHAATFTREMGELRDLIQNQATSSNNRFNAVFDRIDGISNKIESQGKESREAIAKASRGNPAATYAGAGLALTLVIALVTGAFTHIRITSAQKSETHNARIDYAINETRLRNDHALAMAGLRHKHATEISDARDAMIAAVNTENHNRLRADLGDLSHRFRAHELLKGHPHAEAKLGDLADDHKALKETFFRWEGQVQREMRELDAAMKAAMMAHVEKNKEDLQIHMKQLDHPHGVKSSFEYLRGLLEGTGTINHAHEHDNGKGGAN